MSIIQKLLAGVPEQQIKDFQSSMQLHLKQILTTINKHILQDMTQSNIRKNRCFLGCYNYYSRNNQDESNDLVMERLHELRSCKQKCFQQTKEVEKFLDNINFYSKKKFKGCSQKCYKLKKEQAKNSCIWDCYNRLDRRYKQYWANQKTNVEAKYLI